MKMMSKLLKYYPTYYSIRNQVTETMKMEFVDKVKKLNNEGLTKMVEHI